MPSQHRHRSLFSGICGLQPLPPQESAAASGEAGRPRGQAWQEEQRPQPFVRRPAPWPHSDEAAGRSMATYFSSLPHLLRQRRQKHAVPHERVEGAEQLRSTKGGNAGAGFSVHPSRRDDRV